MNALVLSAAMAAIPATGATTSNPLAVPSISVNGTAEVRVAPDELFLSVAVETEGADLIADERINQAHVKSLLDVASRFQIPAERVQTGQVTISTVGSSEVPIVRRTVTICLTDFSKFDDVLASLVKAGGNRVDGIELRSSKVEDARARARIAAVKSAREKATAMANELGEGLAHPLSIVEDGFSGDVRSVYSAGGGPLPSGSSFAAGELEVTATVSVQFALADR
jgi:uncharacterized protein YggE